MKKNKSILVVQPYLTKYRLPVFQELSCDYNVTVAATSNDSYGAITKNELGGISFHPLKEKRALSGRIFWQVGLLWLIVRIRPDLVYFTANPRYLSLWFSLILSKLLGLKVILHGQGLYNKSKVTLLYRLQYGLFSALCHKYICYTDSCKDSLRSMGIYKKSVVAENSIINKFPIKKITNSEKGLLYIGRLREGCNIEFLITVVGLLQKEGESVNLFVVGGGDELINLKTKYVNMSYIHFLGEVYDAKEISDISKVCFAGCYPGDAGLSILHYMSLSLPPIAHSNMTSHMGPEPSYIINGENGLLFDVGSVNSLKNTVKNIKNNSELRHLLQKKSYATYEKLTKPNLGQRLLAVINDVLDANK